MRQPAQPAAKLQLVPQRASARRMRQVIGNGRWQTHASDLVNNRAMDEREALMNLGLSRGATEDEIRSAHKKAARAVHPDHGSEALMASLNEARDVALSAIRGRRLPMRLVQDLVLSQTRVLEQSEAARLYPEVFVEFAGFQSLCGDVRVLPTPVFFWGSPSRSSTALSSSSASWPWASPTPRACAQSSSS